MIVDIKHYKELSKDELYDILKLRCQVFVVEQTCPYLDIDGKDLDAYHLSCYEKDDLIAYLRILKKGVSYEEISIGRVLVKHNYRNKNIGRVMMEKSIDFIENTLNEDLVRISAQAYLESFYKSLGFSPVSDPYLEDDILHLEMLLKMYN